MTFPERVIYQEAIQIVTILRVEAPEYLRLSLMFESEMHASTFTFMLKF